MISLFFVVAAMLEFALVLMVQRKLEGKEENYSKKKISEVKSKQKIGNLMKTTDSFAGGENNDKEDNHSRKVVRLISLQLSTDNIDMMACILFIGCYLLFNVFYWM